MFPVRYGLQSALIVGVATMASAIIRMVPNRSGVRSGNALPNVMSPVWERKKEPHFRPEKSNWKCSSSISTGLPGRSPRSSGSHSSGRTSREYPPRPSGVKTRVRPARSNGLAGTMSPGSSSTRI